MGYVITKISNHGTSNPIVARLSVQSKQLMESFSISNEKQKNIWATLHGKVQPQLLNCYDIYRQFLSEENDIIAEICKCGIQTQSYGRVADIESIDRLEYFAGSFLCSAKAALRDIKLVIFEFYEADAEVKKIIEKDLNYEEVKKWASKKFGQGDCFAQQLAEDYDLWIDEVYSKRNAVEHPDGRSGRLNIFNFTAHRCPESKEWKAVLPPRWQRNQSQPASITRDMQITIENILTFSENVLVHCLHKIGAMIPVDIHEIREEDRDVECPIRLRATKG